jgi:NAD(P)-dependent dehydrogenase (short-subunit alcohol dehydrogenase family)
LADRQHDLAEEAASRLQASGTRVTAAELDVRDFAAFERLVQQTVDKDGRLDYLFNNAGIGIAGDIQLYDIQDWYEMLDVNLRGVIHGIQAACSIMIGQGFGHIVNTASMAGLMPTPGCAGYAATKHAVVGLSESLRIEGATAGVRVSVLCPGWIDTPLLDAGMPKGLPIPDSMVGAPTTREALTKAGTKLYPADLEMRTGLGWSLYKLGRKVDAAKAFVQVLAIAPAHASAKQGLTLAGGAAPK